MKKIHNKLRSRVGASMILAMVFMLFCAFIGGSVLASATANAQRVAQMAEQQDFLLERSAALLLSDQLQLDDGKYLRLTVVDQQQNIQAVTVGNGGVVVPIDGKVMQQRVITFQLSASQELTHMHRLMVESTVLRYLRENAEGESPVVKLENFPDDITSTTKFQFKNTNTDPDDPTIVDNLTVNCGDERIPDYTANLSVGRDTDLYDFFVDFGENSQLKLTMNAYSGSSNPIVIENPPSVDNGTYFENNATVQITVESTQTSISWKDPLIEKGGA